MTPTQIIIFAVSLSFCITKVWQPLQIKPFNCMMCLTGWLSLVACFWFGWFGLLFLPVGCFAGAIVESFIMRWL